MTQAERPWNIALRAQSEDALEVIVYDIIGRDFWTGEGVTSQDFLEQLNAAPKAKEIALRVNSVGGLVDHAKAMGNLLAKRAAEGAKVVGYVDGIAASAAAYLLTFAARVVMPSNTFQMIHGVRADVRGTVEDVEAGAQLMRRTNAQLAEAFAAASARRGKGKTKEDFLAAFAKGDLYLDAAEALEWGLADETTEATKMAACLADLSGIEHAPPALMNAPFVTLNGARPQARVGSIAVQLPLPTPPAPVVRAQQTPLTGKENTMPTDQNTNTSLVAIVAALGLTSGATESDIQNRIRRLTDMEREAMSLAGVTDSTHTLGALRGMAEKAKAHDELKAELDKVKAERDKQNFETLIAKGKSPPVKLSPATAKLYEDRFAAAVAEGRGADVVADLQGFLAVAPTIIASSSVSPAQAPASSGSNPLLWNGKTYGELKPMERHQLAKENKELFNLMREEHQRQSAA